ncbi:hypothetical protein D0N87_06425 [Pseudomonas sp. ATCC 13867]|nr:hypothetical protein D0N87_06425 [Pseudomonas sp. ATCC 13867]
MVYDAGRPGWRIADAVRFLPDSSRLGSTLSQGEREPSAIGIVQSSSRASSLLQGNAGVFFVGASLLANAFPCDAHDKQFAPARICAHLADFTLP